jgi:hypothetical protein
LNDAGLLAEHDANALQYETLNYNLEGEGGQIFED